MTAVSFDRPQRDPNRLEKLDFSVALTWIVGLGVGTFLAIAF